MPPAARALDPTSHPGVISGPCSIDVLINNRPAARKGDLHACALPPVAGPPPPRRARSPPAAPRSSSTTCPRHASSTRPAAGP